MNLLHVISGRCRAMALAAAAAFLPAAAVAEFCSPSAKASTPSADFIANADGTVAHIPTGLTWKRCPEGMGWDGTVCTGVATAFTWQQALQRAKAVNDSGGFGGMSDWHLPDVKALQSMVEYRCFSPALNTTVFNDAGRFGYWSSSAVFLEPDNAWFINAGSGDLERLRKTTPLAVRLVRGG